MFSKNTRYYLRKNQAQPFMIFSKVLPQMPENLSDLIQRRMRDLEIPSKAEFARRLGISPAYAGDLANGTGKTKEGVYNPGKDLVPKLAEVLEVDESEILAAMNYLPSHQSKIEEILEGATVSFDEKKFTKAEREKLIEAMRLIALGVMAEQEKEQ